MKKVFRVILGLIIVLLLVITIKTITFRSMQIRVEPVTPPSFGTESVANLSRALTFHTVSYELEKPIDTLAFISFHQFLAESYPLIHATMKKELNRIIADDRVKIAPVGIIQEPSPVSPENSAGFELIHKTVRQIFPEVMVTPMMMLGATDSRNFTGVSSNIYKFIPIQFHKDNLTRPHGLNEKISIENFKKAIGFYYQLIKNCQNKTGCEIR